MHKKAKEKKTLQKVNKFKLKSCEAGNNLNFRRKEINSFCAFKEIILSDKEKKTTRGLLYLVQ